MARFKFRLEALLTVRQQAEKEQQRRVAEAHREVRTLMQQIQETDARIAAENRTLGAKELTGRLDMQYIGHEKRFVGNLQLKIALALRKLAELEQNLAARRAELLEAARARKVMEKLKEKQLERWRAEQDRKEAAIMDEIGMRTVNMDQ